MAEFDINVATERLSVTYTPNPIVAAASLLPLFSSSANVVTTQLTTQMASYPTHAGYVAGHAYLPGASMPAATKWLTFGHMNMGTGDVVADVVCGFTQGTGGAKRVFTKSESWGVGHGTPLHARSGSLNAWAVIDGTGQDVGFEFSNVSNAGRDAYFGSSSLVAIPLHQLAADQDYFYGKHATLDSGVPGHPAPALIATTTTPTDIFSVTFTIPFSEEYVILAYCGTKSLTANTIPVCTLYENGVQIQDSFQKISFDSRDFMNANFLDVRALSAGSVTYTLKGNSSTGGDCYFYTPRILLIRKGAFQSVAHTQTFLNTITSTHPAWTTAASVAFSPFQTVEGEYALVLGKTKPHRHATQGFSLSRLVNLTSGPGISEFVSVTKPHASSSATRPTSLSFAVELINTTQTYGVQVTGEPGLADTTVNLIGIQAPNTLVVIGLTPTNIVGTNQPVTINDTSVTPNGDDSGSSFNAPGGGGSPNLDINDTSGSSNGADSVSTSVNGAAPGIPDVHPRLWFYNNNRLARITASRIANDQYWQTFIATKTNNDPPWHCWPYGMQYLANPNPTTLAEAIVKVDQLLNQSMGANFEDDGVFTGEYAKEAAMLYDWLYDVLDEPRKRKLEDFMIGIMYMQLTGDSISRAIYPSDDMSWGWGVGSPMNNYHATQIKGLAYIAVALFHHQPTTWGFPWGTTNPANRYPVSIPFKINTAPYFTDLYECLLYKLDNLSMLTWDNPNAKPGNTCYGGGWNEGAHYGQRPWRDIPEIASILKLSGAKDYLSSPIFRDRIYYILYDSLPHVMPRPGGTSVVAMELGDNTGGPVDGGSSIGSSHRISMMMCVEAFQGSIEAQYGQFWLQNTVLNSNSGVITSTGSDMLHYDPTFQARDYRVDLVNGHHYSHANGCVAMRNHFGSDGTAVYIAGQDCHEEHADHDQMALHIFKGASGIGFEWDGNLLGDYRDGGGGNFWESDCHATYRLCLNHPAVGGGLAGGQQRFADYNTYPNMTTVTGSVQRENGTPLYGYCRVESNDGYRGIPTNVSSYETSTFYNQPKVNDIAHRCLFYLKMSNLVITYDRIRLVGTYVDGPITAIWPCPRQQPTLQGSDVMVTQGNNRLFRRYVGPVLQAARRFVQSSGTRMNYWREEQDLNLSNGYGKLLTVHQATIAAVGSMTTTFQNGTDPLDTLEGVTFNQTTVAQHVLFSKAQDGSLTGTIRYSVQKYTQEDTHYVTDLVPFQQYFVTENNLTGPYFSYVLQTASTGFFADKAGVLTFRPMDLGGQNAVSVLINDLSLTFLGVDTVTYALIGGQIINDDTPAVGGFGQDVAAVNVNATAQVLDILDFSPSSNGVDVAVIGNAFTLEDSLTGVDSVSTEVIPFIETIPVISTEKTIKRPTGILVPVADISSSWTFPVPSNVPSTLFDKLGDNDGDTYVVIPQGLASQSSMTLEMGDPLGTVGDIFGFQIRVRVRSADLSGSGAPVLNLVLSNVRTGNVYVVTQVSPQTSETPIDYLSAFFQMSIQESWIKDKLSLRVEPRASIYSTYTIQYSEVGVIVATSGREKKVSS